MSKAHLQSPVSTGDLIYNTTYKYYTTAAYISKLEEKFFPVQEITQIPFDRKYHKAAEGAPDS